jgi:hypothetical protein
MGELIRLVRHREPSPLLPLGELDWELSRLDEALVDSFFRLERLQREGKFHSVQYASEDLFFEWLQGEREKVTGMRDEVLAKLESANG